jgi:uncharacterized protein YktB (UPF0637 family)
MSVQCGSREDFNLYLLTCFTWFPLFFQNSCERELRRKFKSVKIEEEVLEDYNYSDDTSETHITSASPSTLSSVVKRKKEVRKIRFV